MSSNRLYRLRLLLVAVAVVLSMVQVAQWADLGAFSLASAADQVPARGDGPANVGRQGSNPDSWEQRCKIRVMARPVEPDSIPSATTSINWGSAFLGATPVSSTRPGEMLTVWFVVGNTSLQDCGGPAEQITIEHFHFYVNDELIPEEQVRGGLMEITLPAPPSNDIIPYVSFPYRYRVPGDAPDTLDFTLEVEARDSRGQPIFESDDTLYMDSEDLEEGIQYVRAIEVDGPRIEQVAFFGEPNPVEAGAIAAFRLTIRNPADSGASIAGFSVEPGSSNGLMQCNTNNMWRNLDDGGFVSPSTPLEPGKSAQCSYEVLVPTDPNVTTLQQQGEITVVPLDPNVDPVTIPVISDEVVIGFPGLEVEKRIVSIMRSGTEVPLPGPARAGDLITYEVVMENTGDFDLDRFSVSDSLVGPLAMEPGFALPVGESFTLDQYSYLIPYDTASPLENVVTVDAYTPADRTVRAQSAASVQVLLSDLQVILTAHEMIDGPIKTEARDGETIWYKLQIINNGDTIATNIDYDTMSPLLHTYGDKPALNFSLAAETAASPAWFPYTVDMLDPAYEDPLTSTVRIKAVAGGRTVYATSQSTVDIVNDFVQIKSRIVGHEGDSVLRGDTVTYELTVQNMTQSQTLCNMYVEQWQRDPSTGQLVLLNGSLLLDTWNWATPGELAAGESATGQVTYLVGGDVSDPLDMRFHIMSTTTCGTTVGDTHEDWSRSQIDVSDVQLNTRLRMLLPEGQTQAIVGEPVTFSYTATNTSTVTLTTVQATYCVPHQGGCPNGALQFTQTDLTPFKTLFDTFEMTFTEADVNATDGIFPVVVTLTGIDNEGHSVTISTTVQVSLSTDRVALNVTAPETAVIGDTITVDYTLVNMTSEDLVNVCITNLLDGSQDCAQILDVPYDSSGSGALDWVIDSTTGVDPASGKLTIRLMAEADKEISGDPVKVFGTAQVQLVPVLSVEKQADKESVAVGGDITYTVKVFNNSRSQEVTITGVQDDVANTYGQTIALPGDPIPPLSSTDITYSISGVAVTPNPLVNNVTVSGETDGGAAVQGGASASVNIECPVQFAVQPNPPRMVDGTFWATLGKTVDWHFYAANVSSGPLTNVSLTLDGQPIAGAPTIMEVGFLEEVATLQETVDFNDYSTTSLTSFLEHELAATFSGSSVTNCSQTVRTLLWSPVWVTKIADPPLAFAGQQVTYHIRVETIPESDRGYDVTLTDDMLGVNEFIGRLEPGDVWEQDYTYTVKESDPDELTNQAIAEFPVDANNFMWTMGEALVYTRTPLQLTVTPKSDVVVPGTPLEFDYELLNTSPYPISGIWVEDTLLGTQIGPIALGPGQVWPDPNLPPGESPNPFVYQVPLNPPDPVRNTVTAGGTDDAPMQILINGATADLQPISQTVSIRLQEPDVTIDKRVFQSNPAAGPGFDGRVELPDVEPAQTGGDGTPEWNQVDPVDFCFEVSNNNDESPDAFVDNIRVTDAKLDGLLGTGKMLQDLFEQAVIDAYDHDDYLDRLYGGESVQFCTEPVNLSREYFGDPAINTATLVGTVDRDGTPLPIYDEDRVVVDILDADLLFTKQASVPAAYVGQEIMYTIRVENRMTEKLVDVHIYDQFLGGERVEIPWREIDWSGAGGLVGEIVGGGFITIQYPFTIGPDAPDPLENVATIEALVFDSSNSDPSTWDRKVDSTRTAVAVSSSQLVVNKEASAVVGRPGDTVDYAVTITNIGDGETVWELEAEDDRYTEQYGGSLTGLLSQSNVRPWIETVDAAYSLQLPTAEQLAAPGGEELDPFINTVRVSGCLHDSSGACIETIEADATWAVDILQPGIRVIKTPQQQAAAPGETVEYTVIISNPSDGDSLTDLTATDLFDDTPVDLTTFTFVSADQAKNGQFYDPDTPDLDTLAPFERLEGTVAVTVPDDWTGTEFTNTVEATGTSADILVRDRSAATIDIRDEGIEVQKRALPVAAPVGATVTYTIEVTNVGNVPIRELVIADPGIAGESVTISGSGAFPDGDDSSRLEPDETYRYIYEYVLQEEDPDPYLNRARVVAYFDGGTAVIGLADALVDIQAAQIVVDKRACAGDHTDGADIEWGEDVALPDECADVLNVTESNIVTYFLRVRNTGRVDLYDLAIQDILVPASLFDTVVWPGPENTLTANDFQDGSGTDELWISYRYTVQPGDPDPLVNRVSVEGRTIENYIVQDSAQASLVVVSSDLRLTKQALIDDQPVTSAEVGDTITYRLTVQNLNGNPAANPLTAVTVVDPLSASGDQPVCTFAEVTDVPQVCEFTHVVSAADGSPLINTAIASATQGEVTVWDDASSSVNVIQGGIELTKQASVPVARVGDTVTFNYTITNTTMSVLRIENVLESDPALNTQLQASKPWKRDLLPGETTSFYATRTMTIDDQDPYTNTITVEALLLQENVRRVAQATESVALVSSVSDLVVENTPSQPVVRDGDPVTFMYKVINLGDAAVTNVTVTDNLGAGALFGPETLEPGQSVLLYRVVTASAPGPLVSVVRAEGDGSQIDTASAEVRVVTGDVALLKTADRVIASAGDVIHYTIQVRNMGSEAMAVGSGDVQDDLIGMLVEPTFPPSLPPSGALTWTGTYVVPADADVVNNTATVTVEGVDSGTSYTATDQVSVPVIEAGLPGNLVVTQSVIPSTAKPGDPVTFVFRVKNVSTNAVENGTLTHDLVPAPMPLPALLPGNEFITTLTLSSDYVIPDAGVAWNAWVEPYLSNVAEVSIGEDVQDRATARLQVQLLDLAKVVSPTVRMGETLAWSFQITSFSQGNITGVTLEDDLLAQFGSVSWTNPIDALTEIPPAGYTATASIDLPADQEDSFYDQFEPNRIIVNEATVSVAQVEQASASATTQIVGLDVAGLRVYQVLPAEADPVEIASPLKTGNETFVEFTLQNLSTTVMTLGANTFTVLVDGQPVACELPVGVELPGTLAVDELITVTCRYIPPIGAQHNTNLTPELVVNASGQAGGEVLTDSARVQLEMVDVQLSVGLTVDPATTWAGETVKYAVVVTNRGASPIGCDSAVAAGLPCHLDIAADDPALNTLLVPFRDTLADTVLASGASLSSGDLARAIMPTDASVLHEVTVSGGYYSEAVEVAGLLNYLRASAYDTAQLEVLRPMIQIRIEVEPDPPVFGQPVLYRIIVTNIGQVPINQLTGIYQMQPVTARSESGIALTGRELRPDEQSGALDLVFTPPLLPGEDAVSVIRTTETHTDPYGLEVEIEAAGAVLADVVSETAARTFAPQIGATPTPTPTLTPTVVPGVTSTLPPGVTATPLTGATITPVPGASITPVPPATVTPVPGTTGAPGTSSGGGNDPVLAKRPVTEAAQPGGALAWEITVANQGTTQIPSVVVQDQVPDSMIVGTAFANQGTVTVSGQLVTATTGPISPGTVVTITINTTVGTAVTSPSTLTNTACGMVQGGYAQFCEAAQVNIGPAVDVLPTTGIRAGSLGARLDGVAGLLAVGVFLVLMTAQPSNRRVWAAVLIVLVALVAIGAAVAVLMSQGDDPAENAVTAPGESGGLPDTAAQPGGGAASGSQDQGAAASPNGDAAGGAGPAGDGAAVLLDLPENPAPVVYVPPTPSGVRQIVIPKLAEQFDVPVPIVNLPIVNRQWDVSGLGYYVGWLEGTTWLDADWGNTVLAAHVQLGTSIPGPFWGLDMLGQGDEILIREGEREYRYLVRSVEKVDPGAWDVTTSTGEKMLTLLTCTEWDNHFGVFSQRLVVRAVPAESFTTG